MCYVSIVNTSTHPHANIQVLFGFYTLRYQWHSSSLILLKVTFPLWLNADILAGPVAPTTKPLDPEKFIKLAAKHPRAVLSIGWTTQYGGNITAGEYTREQIGTMLRMINTHRVNQTVTFPVSFTVAVVVNLCKK